MDREETGANCVVISLYLVVLGCGSAFSSLQNAPGSQNDEYCLEMFQLSLAIARNGCNIPFLELGCRRNGCHGDSDGFWLVKEQKLPFSAPSHRAGAVVHPKM